MSDQADVDYGPLTELIGKWEGDKGLDIAPDPDGVEQNPYYETITFAAAGAVENAESQTLVAVHYRQIVSRKSDHRVFHDQTGYWMWDAQSHVMMHSLTIPRAVGLLAGGKHSGERNSDGSFIFDVVAGINNKDWQIVQSAFMRDHARTIAFQMHIVVGKGELSYSQKTTVDIYGKIFEHTDENKLKAV
ncbi:MAG: hypothetical protein CO186_05485 [Zetaproteobacteria bacterium CG_4_9_14_3_um_filter_49_83]|nr:MAG: hypothetical protein AUJ56_01115 [Zetaproteobacteria bacterium CG1_02_49_23]PIQ33849.1 MAG: hypothetical protein COW62_04220 [Zetaproteobacteria bacterium CG17_big_fil_post_rev_8_21_14_2_50_50_13]PIV29494.1 MAG: hypothetical protein COS35_11660 [Zetaproteobacteria bacterium CG02_land_8_20_14_3_00_50_9]PIY55557.1 MAG: hypothetical protein COZ00_08555 [Zetaproteobacteria bacterium CG_4_10_14_0_8_um_filter_49_80]PJA35450.1 MAG: hypothetical protein CO186_05485 [Zetaproteobacteria bacterium